MKSILVYDPAMCCPTGICGPNVDPDLVNFAGMLYQLGSMGVTVKRYNLAQNPAEYAIHPQVKEALAQKGTSVLPLIFWDGELRMQGRYPTRDERPAWYKAAKEEHQ